MKHLSGWAIAHWNGVVYIDTVRWTRAAAIDVFTRQYLSANADEAERLWRLDRAAGVHKAIKVAILPLAPPEEMQMGEISEDAVEAACKAMAAAIARQDGVTLTKAGYDRTRASRPEEHAMMHEYVRAALAAALPHLALSTATPPR